MTRPKTKLTHGMLCSRRAPLVETIRLAPTGQAYAVTVCTECDHDDMAERIERDATRSTSGGDAA